MTFVRKESRLATGYVALEMLVIVVCLQSVSAQGTSEYADANAYLAALSVDLGKDWPHNRTINIVCHGHSVPAGYFATPEVRSLEAYPHRLRVGLARRFPHAVVNVIVTAIGGENSESGARRFSRDVLSHRPDVITIDYALNDRGIGLERARNSWQQMIEIAQANKIKVILLTPTADLQADLSNPHDSLQQHAAQIRDLAGQYQTGLVDSLAAFQQFAASGGDLEELMSQSNHPNGAGHKLVADRLLDWFPAAGNTADNGPSRGAATADAPRHSQRDSPEPTH